MGNKQTAVEWLIEQLECFGNKHELQMSWATVDELFKQAKEMEKEQMKLIYSPAIMQNEDGKFCVKTFEKYYNETYGKE